MTATEIRLANALKGLKSIAHSKPHLLSAAARAAIGPPPSTEERTCLARLNLDPAYSLVERLMRWSVLWALRNNALSGGGGD
jgi:hypothetical protein